MVYGMAWWARNGVRYGLAAMAWLIVWPGGHHMVYGEVLSCYVERHSITCFKELSWATVPFKMEWPMSVGGPIHTYLTCSQVEGLLHACSIHTDMYSSCTALGSDSKQRDCESIDHFFHSYCALSVNQAFVLKLVFLCN